LCKKTTATSKRLYKLLTCSLDYQYDKFRDFPSLECEVPVEEWVHMSWNNAFVNMDLAYNHLNCVSPSWLYEKFVICIRYNFRDSRINSSTSETTIICDHRQHVLSTNLL
jgi:hypothetical protein